VQTNCVCPSGTQRFCKNDSDPSLESLTLTGVESFCEKRDSSRVTVNDLIVKLCVATERFFTCGKSQTVDGGQFNICRYLLVFVCSEPCFGDSDFGWKHTHLLIHTVREGNRYCGLQHKEVYAASCLNEGRCSWRHPCVCSVLVSHTFAGVL